MYSEKIYKKLKKNRKSQNSIKILKEIPAVHVHKDSGAREVAKHHYWYKYRSQLFLEGFRGRRKYRHVRKELTHKVSDRLRVTQAQK